jgi:phosphodiesterase/alkaline phosphatase D-like protein
MVEQDVDIVSHLGDYIYETNAGSLDESAACTRSTRRRRTGARRTLASRSSSPGTTTR